LKINLFNIKYLFISLIFYSNIVFGQKNTDNTTKDSIDTWIKKSRKTSLQLTKRNTFLDKAYNRVNKLDNNIYKSKTLSTIAYRYYTIKDTISFKKINAETLQLATQLKDTFTIADSHWSYAYFYNNQQKYNAAFYHYNNAFEGFKKLNDKYKSARMLYAMAFIKGRYRDYTGSEILTFQAIKIFKKLKNYKWLYQAYNDLGLLQQDIKEYDKAISYFNKAIFYRKKIEGKKTYYSINNNIAMALTKKGEYNEAMEYFNKEVSKKLTRKQQAIILNNRARCMLYQNDTTNLKNDLYKALYIRDSLNDKTGIISTKLYISDYYKHIQDSISALKFSEQANELAYKIKNGDFYLRSLKQLANLDTQNSKKYLDRYIEFNDSLINTERRTQNKFTRIEFETDEYIEETERLNQQQVWIITISIAGILILSLLYFLRVQKVKNEKLRLETEQQKANEEVYILTLQQQAKLEEEKIKERNRISEELHDGVLGKLFGTRFGLGFLNIKGDDDVLEKHQSFLNELQDIEKEIRDVSHKLSDNFDNSAVNFTSIIEQLIKDKSELGSFKYQFNIDDTISWKTTSEITKANVYRIIQEALQNILKHAKAEKVTLAFIKEKQFLIINLKDNGVGFNTKKGKNGIGLKNIKSRVQKLKGSVEFLSEINKGTILVIKIPL
jgi:signal transduction histidine kinase